jgi:hypothetical protein
MRAVLLMLLFASEPAAPSDEARLTFQTEKSSQQIAQCLTERLRKRGDVTAVEADGYITLVYNDGTHLPMVIDVAPPTITVTTQVAYGTPTIVKSCL